MLAFWRGFEKRADEDKQLTPGQVGLATGAATTGGLAAHHVARAIAQEARERKLVPGSKSWKEFVKNLQPGDILFSRRTHNKHLIDVKDMLQGGMGSAHYHSSLYTGKGRIFEHPGEGFKSSYNPAKLQLGKGEDVVAYRPDVSAGAKRRAVTKVPKSLTHRAYKTKAEVLAMGAKNLFIPGGGGKSCSKTPSGRIVCTTVPQHAYPQLFNDTTNIEEMRRNPKMKMVGRLERAKPKFREKVLYRGVYPIARNLKWGLGAGTAAYIGKKIHDRVKGKGPVAPPATASATPEPSPQPG